MASNGRAVPASSPRTMPATASASTWIRQTVNTVRVDAPRQRSVAMVRARASSQARTPFATPMPPTSSEVSPTRVRNWLVWSMNRVTPGAASLVSRMRQPVSGNAARSCAARAGTADGDGTVRRSA